MRDKLRYRKAVPRKDNYWNSTSLSGFVQKMQWGWERVRAALPGILSYHLF